MGLGLSTNSTQGDFVPFVKFDARAGRLFRVDRIQVNGAFESRDVDITRDAIFVADLANIKVGWINYTTQGPIKQLAILGQAPIPARPADVNAEGKPAFRQGFEINLSLAANCKGEGAPLRTLSSAAGCVIEAMDALHDAYTSAANAEHVKAGKLPAIRIVDTIPVKSGQSTNYKPIFEIMSWVDRPASLTLSTTTAAAPAANAPPATGSTTVAPPAAAPAPQPATASAQDFG